AFLCVLSCSSRYAVSFVVDAPPTPESYTLSLHDALPIFRLAGGDLLAELLDRDLAHERSRAGAACRARPRRLRESRSPRTSRTRSEEHTSELQSRENLVCRLLLEKKKKNRDTSGHSTRH